MALSSPVILELVGSPGLELGKVKKRPKRR